MSSGAGTACHVAVSDATSLFTLLLSMLEKGVISVPLSLTCTNNTQSEKCLCKSAECWVKGTPGGSLKHTHTSSGTRKHAILQCNVWMGKAQINSGRKNFSSHWTALQVGTQIFSKQFTVGVNNTFVVGCASDISQLFEPEHAQFARATRGAGGFQLTHSSSMEEIQNLQLILSCGRFLLLVFKGGYSCISSQDMHFQAGKAALSSPSVSPTPHEKAKGRLSSTIMASNDGPTLAPAAKIVDSLSSHNNSVTLEKPDYLDVLWGRGHFNNPSLHVPGSCF